MSCVEVKNVFKSYANGEKEEKILNGISMSVDRGTIYTLIGASGCGKTTLLSCLMGVQEAQSGELLVFKRKARKIPKLIGFMPQTTSLCAELTIRETLQYFGTLHQMTRATFQARLEMVTALLDLPAIDRQIRGLSGGQQRRVSLAVTIIHDPQLLILDEPTVGLDFLLREKIWNFLFEKTASEGLTTIITTHYISEASNSQRCGFMRNGVLIAEDRPAVILERLGVTTLDEAFYRLCTKEGGALEGGEAAAEEEPKAPARARKVTISEEESEVIEEVDVDDDRGRLFRPAVMRGLLVKEFHRIRRQPLEILIIALPLVQFFLFLITIGNIPDDLELGVINVENPSCDSYRAGQPLEPIACLNETLSCEFERHLQTRKLKTIAYKTYASAFDDFRNGRIFGIVTIPQNFTEVIHSESENRTGTVDVLLDESKFHFNYHVRAELVTGFVEVLDIVSTRCRINEFLRARPLRFEYQFGELSYELKTLIMTAIILAIPFSIMMILSLLIITDARTAGVWNRTILSGVKMSEIVLANVIESVLISFFVSLVIMTAQPFLIDIAFVGSRLLVFMIVFEAQIVGFMLGFFVSILFDDFLVTSGIGQMIVISNTFIGGVLWPVEAISPWLLPLTYAVPFSLPIISLRNVMLKGYGLFHPTVLVGFGAFSGWIVMLSVLSTFALRKRKFSRF